jgi:hypothetical protein
VPHTARQNEQNFSTRMPKRAPGPNDVSKNEKLCQLPKRVEPQPHTASSDLPNEPTHIL